MSQHKDHFTPRMFHRLLAPSLAYSLGLAFAAMADAIVIGWQMGATGLAAPSASRWILCLCRVWGWARPAPPVLP